MGSQEALLVRFAALVKGEREAEAELLAALGEVDEAKLYAVAGYGSLFAFCVEAHGMSEARAVKRIRAARLAGRHPRLLGMLRRGELRLGGIHVLGKLLDGAADPDRVLDRARGKTVRARPGTSGSAAGRTTSWRPIDRMGAASWTAAVPGRVAKPSLPTRPPAGVLQRFPSRICAHTIGP